VALEELHLSLVLFCCLSCPERAQVAAFARLRISLSRVKPVLARFQFSNHKLLFPFFAEALFLRIRFERRAFAFSSSVRRAALNPSPARLMKYVSMRKPEVGPFGETSFDASALAMAEALFVNSPGGGCVESVLTRATHLLGWFFATVRTLWLGLFLALPFDLLAAMLRLTFQEPSKPLAGKFRNLLQCSRLLKQMSRARHDRDRLLTPKLIQRSSIQPDYRMVIAANNE
jgi:hypothetical protein